MMIADIVAMRGDCRRRQVGCVIVDKEHRILATGYNGSYPGGPSCLKGECPRGLLSYEECKELTSYENCIAQHAEPNAAAYTTRQLAQGGTVYVTSPICDMCWKTLRALGLGRACWEEGGRMHSKDLP